MGTGSCDPANLNAGVPCTFDAECDLAAPGDGLGTCTGGDLDRGFPCTNLGAPSPDCDTATSGDGTGACSGNGDGSCESADCPDGMCRSGFRGDACNDCTADADGDGIVDLLDTCPADPVALQIDSNLDGRGDICEMQGPDLLVGTAAGGAGTLTLFSGDGKGRLFYPTGVAPAAVPSLDSVALLAAGALENLSGITVFAVENSGAADSLRVLLADSQGRFTQTDVLDPADPGRITPPIPAAEFRDLLAADLNRDGSDDLLLAEATAGVCAAADLNAGARCAADPDCDRSTAGDGLGQCVGNGAVVIAFGARAATCLGGPVDGQPCLFDADCPDGTCGQGGVFVPPGTPVVAGASPAALRTVQFDDDDGDGVPTGNDDIDVAVVHRQGPAGPASGNLLVLESLFERRADIDGSGRVDGFDLSRLARGFGIVYDRLCVGGSCSFPPEDLNLDGEVDGMDLAVLTSRFGRRF
ncbi:MAG: hypothetical protein HY509_01760 [Acidobacteria bacterium]|nr:hypothetical protein [Acidobacteriota bacterium]